MQNVLLIWEEVPEDTSIYLIQDLDEETAKRLMKFHQSFINITGDMPMEDVEWLINFRESQQSNLISSRSHDYDQEKIYNPNGWKVHSVVHTGMAI